MLLATACVLLRKCCAAHDRSINRRGARSGAAKNLNYDGLQLANVKYREQPLPPTAVVGFNSDPGAAKDRSPVANIEPDRAIIDLKRMPITPVAANHDATDVACRKINGLAVERAALINHFERGQNSALLGIVDFDRFICKPCCYGVE